MGLQLYISGEDFSDYIVESVRENSICNPVGQLSLQMSTVLPRKILTYEPVTFYENEVKVFTGYVGDVNLSRMPASCSVTCYDMMIKAKDKWLKGDELISGGESIGYWVGRFLGAAGIPGLVVDDPGDQGVYPGFGWNNMTCMDAIIQTLQMSPYQIICDGDGHPHLMSMRRDTPVQTIDGYIDFERAQNDRWVRNRIVVMGVAPAVADVFAPNEYIPGEIRAAIVATGAIHNEVTASELAERMRVEFSQPLDVKIVTIPGDPTLEIGQTVSMVETWSDYSEYCLITGLASTYSEHGYILELTLDEKCPNFWGWDSPPAVPLIMYCSSWGYGVYKSVTTGLTWSPTELGKVVGKYVYAMDVYDDDQVWASCTDGAYLTRDGGDLWTRQSLGNPAGGGSVTEGDLSLVGIRVDPNDELKAYILATYVGMAWIYYTHNRGTSWGSVRVI